MLANSQVMPTIPVTDIQRAIDFYTNKLGLKRSSMEVEKGIATNEGTKTAWFKDPDGNILGIVEAK